MNDRAPQIYVIAGPNGSGKTTSAKTLLPELLNCHEYVNADSVAAALSPFNPDAVAIQAGRLMLERIHYLAGSICNFFTVYQKIATNWFLYDNREEESQLIARKMENTNNVDIIDELLWKVINEGLKNEKKP
ncbi:MAG: hypothetical protein KBD23_04000 [Gammaproteobacteria bacterium]|nr:hypothetical protein [Gammaproteobacteria bacterium]